MNRHSPPHAAVSAVRRLHRAALWALGIAVAWLVPMGLAQAWPAPISLAGGQGSVSLDGQAQYWVDSSGEVPAAAVLQADDTRWTPLRDSAVVGQAMPAATWVRFAVQAGAGQRLFLELPHAQLLRATLYETAADGTPAPPQSSGILVPVSSWPMHGHNLVFPVAGREAQTARLLLRLEHPVPVGGALMLRDTDDLLRHQALSHGLIGAYFGLALLALLYIAVQAVALRDRALVWCALYLLAVIVVMAAVAGFAHRTLLGEVPAASLALLVLSPLLLGAMGLRFVIAAVPQAVIALLPRVVTWVLVAAAVGIALAYAWLPVTSAWFISRGYLFIAGLWALALLLASLRWRLPHVRWMVLGFGAMLLGGAMPLFKGLGLLPSETGAQYGMLMGSAIELPLLLYAMSLLRRDHEVVAARLREGRQYDRLTGLLRAAALTPRLAQMALRGRRHRIGSAAVLFELANLHDIRIRQGDAVADEALVLTGRLLQRGAHASDAVVRLDDSHFVALLDGVASRDEATATATRIIGEGRRYTGELGDAETLELHAVIAHLPDDMPGTPQELVAELQATLGRMHRGSGVAVRQLREARNTKPSILRQWRATAPAQLEDRLP
jgi:GGDEF domain-containing protein